VSLVSSLQILEVEENQEGYQGRILRVSWQ